MTVNEAKCGFDSSCIYRIPMRSSSHINFAPCTVYNVSITVKSYELIYCEHPSTISKVFETNTRGTVSVECTWLVMIEMRKYLYLIILWTFSLVKVVFLFNHISAPAAVKNVYFSNYDGSYWNAQIRWQAPEIDTCVYQYM